MSTGKLKRELKFNKNFDIYLFTFHNISFLIKELLSILNIISHLNFMYQVEKNED